MGAVCGDRPTEATVKPGLPQLRIAGKSCPPPQASVSLAVKWDASPCSCTSPVHSFRCSAQAPAGLWAQTGEHHYQSPWPPQTLSDRRGVHGKCGACELWTCPGPVSRRAWNCSVIDPLLQMPPRGWLGAGGVQGAEQDTPWISLAASP